MALAYRILNSIQNDHSYTKRMSLSVVFSLAAKREALAKEKRMFDRAMTNSQNAFMTRLPSIQCPDCHSNLEDIEPEAESKAAVDYGSCRRRCEKCGLGFSNARTDKVEKLTIIYRDCFKGIPTQISDGYDRVLFQALNKTARASKTKRFTFSTSEDHLTWTVFRTLQLERQLRATLERIGVKFLAKTHKEPTMLLWGSPVPANEPDGEKLLSRLIAVSTKLEEKKDRRSEPDVILDFGSTGLVFIEVKHRSRNAFVREDYPNWSRYLKPNNGVFLSELEIRKSGLYELTRNWRIAREMADGAPFAVVNLGPASLFRGKCGEIIKAFACALNQNPQQQFITVLWETFLGDLNAAPPWLQDYVSKRQIGVNPKLGTPSANAVSPAL
jgi:hypothetical protein